MGVTCTFEGNAPEPTPGASPDPGEPRSGQVWRGRPSAVVDIVSQEVSLWVKLQDSRTNFGTRRGISGTHRQALAFLHRKASDPFPVGGGAELLGLPLPLPRTRRSLAHLAAGGGWSASAGGSMPWFPWKPASPRPGRSIRGRPTRGRGDETPWARGSIFGRRILFAK